MEDNSNCNAGAKTQAAYDAPTLHPGGNPILEGKLPDHVGRFNIKRIIGEGGMGVVGLGVETEGHAEKRRVAVKFLKRDVNGSGFESRVFERECKSLARFNHDNIARFIDFGLHEENQRLPYIVMEYVEDATLITDHCAGASKGGKPLPLGNRLGLFLRVCEGIRHAHERNVIHRDISAKNALVGTVDGKPVVKIIDFGISLDDEDEDLREGSAAGTPAYMSPEQLSGNAALVDQRSDIYALGILLCELMVGMRPYEFETTEEAKTALDALETKGTTTAVVPSRLARKISAGTKSTMTGPETNSRFWRRLARELQGDLDAIVAKATALNPDHRYRSVAQFVEDIEEHLRGYPLKHAIKPTPAVRTIKFLHRNALGAAATVVIVALLAGLSANVVYHLQKSLVLNTELNRSNQELEKNYGALNDRTRQMWRAQQESYSSALATFPVLLQQGKLGEARTALASTRHSVDKGWEWDHLLGSSDQSEMVLGHSTNGFARVIDDGKLICAVAGDHSVWFWQSKDGRFLRVNTQHKAEVLATTFADASCFSLDAQGRLITWLAGSGKFGSEAKLEIPDKAPSSGDLLLEAAIDPKSKRVAARWRAGMGTRLGVFDLTSGKAACVPMDLAINGCFCWREDGTLQTVDILREGVTPGSTYRILRVVGANKELSVDAESALRVAEKVVSGYPLEMVSGANLDFLRFADGIFSAKWENRGEKKEGKKVFIAIGAEPGRFESFAISEDGSRGVTAVEGGGINSFTCKAGRIEMLTGGNTGSIGQLIGHAGSVPSLAFAAGKESRVVSASEDGSVRVWNPSVFHASRLFSPERTVAERFDQMPAEEREKIGNNLVRRMRSSQTGWCRMIEDGGSQCLLTIFDAPPWILRTPCSGGDIQTCPPLTGLGVPAFLATDAAVGLDKAPRIVGAGSCANARLMAVLRYHPSTKKMDVAVGNLLVEGTASWVSPVFDRPPLERIAVCDDAFWVVANRMGKDGKTEEVVAWDFNESTEEPGEIVLKPGNAPLGMVTAIEFSPSSNWLALGNAAGQLFLWKLGGPGKKPVEAGALKFNGGIRNIAFAPQDDKIAISLADFSGKGVFDARGFSFVGLTKDGMDGKSIDAGKPAEGWKLSQDICWNPAGTRLASADTDGRLRVWSFVREGSNQSLKDCTLVLNLEEANRDEAAAPLRKVCWSADGRWLAASNADQGCYLYYGAEDDGNRLRRSIQLEIDDLQNRILSTAQLQYRWQDIPELSALNINGAAAAATARIGTHPAEVTRWAWFALVRMAQLKPADLTEERKPARDEFLKALVGKPGEEVDAFRHLAIALANYRLCKFDKARAALRQVEGGGQLRELLEALVLAWEGDPSKANALAKSPNELSESNLAKPLWDELLALKQGQR